MINIHSYEIFGVVMLVFLEITFWKSGPNVNTKLVNNLDYISQRNNMKGTFSVGQVEMFKDQLSPVYRDFLIYKQGVYQVRHAIIGWDTIDGKNFRLVENTWDKIGDKMVLGTYLLIFRCILTNQEKLGLERFTQQLPLITSKLKPRTVPVRTQT